MEQNISDRMKIIHCKRLILDDKGLVFLIIHLLRTDLFVRMKYSLLKPEQTALKLEPVNKSGCSKENELAAIPISSLWWGFRFYILRTIQVQVLVFQ